ncbi:ABC transporter permease [bacterium]|nr:ABC transporter permease [bacterium]
MTRTKRSHLKNTLKESFRMAVDALKANKLRSILTLLGIAIGVFSVIGVMTAIRTLESSINEGLNIFGTNTFLIQKYPVIQMGHRDAKYQNRKNITYDQFIDLRDRAKLPTLVTVAEGTGGISIKYKDEQTKGVMVVGGSVGALRAYNNIVADGRDINQQDIDNYRKVTVIGMDAVDQLFPFDDPLGKVIKIGGIGYTVIGVLERMGELFGQSQDNLVTIPITNYLESFDDRYTSLQITIEAASAELYDKTMDEAIGVLRAIRKVEPGAENDFEVSSNAELIETFSGFTSGVKLFAFAVSVIALVVAGIGIMNIMLVSVTERIKEIGIRKAIGATRRDILTQFLSEAVFLSEFGGIAGVILGIAGGNLVAMFLHVPAQIPIYWAIIGLVVCSVIGIGFGIYPAYKAAKLDPIDALHYE